MNKRDDSVFVWPLCTRLIHWMIALSFLLSLYTAFFHHLFRWHLAFGWMFCIGLVYRLIWGFFGPNYATFRTFKLSIKELKNYFVEKMQNRWRKIYAGHNAASSWFTLIVLSLGQLIVLSGVLLQGTQEAGGLLAFLNPTYFQHSFWLFYAHTAIAYLLALWAIIHISGVLIEQFYHKTNMVFAMVTGYKKAQGCDAKVSIRHHLFAYTVIVFAMISWYKIVYQDDTFLTHVYFSPLHYEQEDHAYAQNCSKCHKNYPPFMLPKASWEKLMDGLDNHFGEAITDKNITRSDQSDIREYLITHSAETSSRKLAFRTLASLGEMRPISMTKVPYWREIHAHIDRSVFKNDHVKNASNCFACHAGFEYGILDNTRIHIPQ